jgi:hypothetical protein
LEKPEFAHRQKTTVNGPGTTSKSQKRQPHPPTAKRSSPTTVSNPFRVHVPHRPRLHNLHRSRTCPRAFCP